MAKQNKKQFDELLNRATIQMKNEIAKREIIHFRVNEHSLKQLQDLALKGHMHVSVLVRDWVLERLAQEISLSMQAKSAPSSKSNDLLYMTTQLEHDLKRMRQHLSALKKSAS